MKKNILFAIFLLCLLLPFIEVLSQKNPNFHFRKIQVDEGLSENTIYCILQDKKGFMWFGTKDGLDRYDGVNFRIFRNRTNDKYSLGNNFIRSMVEGSDAMFYIGTDAGVYIMNSMTETFELLAVKTKTGEMITSAVNSLLIDKNGLLWIGTMHQGIFTYNIQSKVLSKVVINQFSIGQNAVWTIYQDQSGTIWVGTRLGLLRYDATTQKLDAIHGLFSTQNKSDNEVLTILEDTTGILWLGTWAEGLRSYNKYTKVLTSYFSLSDKKNYITHIRTLYQYSENSILIGADDGLYLFDLNKKSCSRLDIAHLNYNLSDQNIYCITKDREGGIWIGTYFGGVNYLNTSLLFIEFYYPNAHPYSLSGKAVSQFCEDPAANLWIATEDGGVNYFDVKTNRFTQPVQTSYHNTHAVMMDDENLWIGTFSRGIDIYNTRTHAVRNLRNNSDKINTLNDDCVFSIYKTKSGEIYVGTPIGLNKYNKSDNSFTHIPQSNGFIYDINEDEYGNLWVASYGNGAIRYNQKQDKWISYDNILPPNDPMIQSKLTGIYIDGQRRLWYASEGRGLFLYNYKTDRFSNISEADGLPNNVIYGILDDPMGNLWISCNKGIVSFNPSEKGIFYLYNKEDGLQSNQFNYKSSFKSRDGKLYFGGINGFNCFYPNDLIRNNNQYIPPIEITGISLLGKSTKDVEQSIQTALNERKSIRLPYNNASFTISYVSLSYVSQTKNQYAYKLVGVDKDWIYTGNNKSVTYVNLTPGKYIFKIKGSNNNGLWNEQGSEIEIIILPPFWLSIPAKILYFILFAIIVYLIVYLYIQRNKRKQKQHLESYKVEQESLAFKSKIDFFTTIAHEIRTPVSLIKAPLEEILNNSMQQQEMIENLLIIEKNSDRLSVLINQLLDFRKMDATTHIVKAGKINLRQHILELYERFKKTAQHKNINFELVFSPQIEQHDIISDADALTKIVGNLLTNALKFTNDSIVLSLVENSDRSFSIAVSDNGIGIPDEAKSLIFDPFFQLKSDKQSVGTGVGLSLVKHLVDALNGRIEVKDNTGGGTLFKFTFGELTEKQILPAYVHTENKMNPIEAINENESRQNILIVEDNIEMMEFLKSSLRHEYLVDAVGSATEAFTMLENSYYDLIISDVMMPGIDGISFVKKIKNDINYSHIPVILLSAKTENSVKIDGLRSGAEVFIEKPFSMAYVKAQILSLLDNRKMLRNIFNRSPLASYSMLTTNRHDDEFLNRINELIEQHLCVIEFSVESLSDILCISRSNLQRKLKNICGVTPGDYLRTYRLKKACKLLLETDMRINEVAFNTGFNSASYFTKVFMKHYGILPKDYVQNNKSQVVR